MAPGGPEQEIGLFVYFGSKMRSASIEGATVHQSDSAPVVAVLEEANNGLLVCCDKNSVTGGPARLR